MCEVYLFTLFLPATLRKTDTNIGIITVSKLAYELSIYK